MPWLSPLLADPTYYYLHYLFILFSLADYFLQGWYLIPLKTVGARNYAIHAWEESRNISHRTSLNVNRKNYIMVRKSCKDTVIPGSSFYSETDYTERHQTMLWKGNAGEPLLKSVQ